jgi:hypothetical protein
MKLMLILLLIFTFLVFAAKTENKILQFNSGEKIIYADATENYISTITWRETDRNYKTYLYNWKGESLFEFGFVKAPISQSVPIDQFGFLVIIIGGDHEAGEPNIIKSFDVHSGKLMWEIQSTALDYEFSPDRNWLINSRPLSYCLELINIKSGTMKPLNISFQEAHFIDNKNILLASQTSSRIREDEDPGVEKIRLAIDEIQETRSKLGYNYQNRITSITKDEYDKQWQKLYAKEDSLNNIIDTITTRTIIKDKDGNILYKSPESKGYKLKHNTVSVVIYNINDGSITNEIQLHDKAGNNLFIFRELGIGPVHIDQESNIYFYADVETGNVKFLSLLKFNRNFELQWQKPMERASLKKIIQNGNLFFLEHKAGKICFINNENGVSVDTSDFRKSHPDVSISEIVQKNHVFTIKILDGIKIDRINSTISIENN